jgi:hypothetical protein
MFGSPLTCAPGRRVMAIARGMEVALRTSAHEKQNGLHATATNAIARDPASPRSAAAAAPLADLRMATVLLSPAGPPHAGF